MNFSVRRELLEAWLTGELLRERAATASPLAVRATVVAVQPAGGSRLVRAFRRRRRAWATRLQRARLQRGLSQQVLSQRGLLEQVLLQRVAFLSRRPNQT